MKAFAALLLLTALAYSQQPPSTVPQQLDAMKECAFLQGSWKGDGWMMMGPSDRRTFTETESVQPKLNGLLLQIEGLGTNTEGKTVHEALAVLSYDPYSKSYKFRAYDGQGHFTDASCDCKDNTFTWNLPMGPRTMRYTIRLNEKQQWHEVGEISPDGTNWQKFFEMTLDKAK